MRRSEFIILAIALVSAFAFLATVVNFESAETGKGSEIVPVSLDPTRQANYLANPTRLGRIAAVRLGLIQDAISDSDPGADASARFAAVENDLLTPVAWLVSPTPSRTIAAAPAPTSTPGDPWIAFGAWRVGCRTELRLPPVSALKLKFQMIGGGGKDNRISYNCCGSTGVSWQLNNAWLSAADQIPWLDLGVIREINNLGGGSVTMMRFDLGCNDHETADITIYYLPALTPPAAQPLQTGAATSSTTTRPPPLASPTATQPLPLQTPSRITTLTPLPTGTQTRATR